MMTAQPVVDGAGLRGGYRSSGGYHGRADTIDARPAGHRLPERGAAAPALVRPAHRAHRPHSAGDAHDGGVAYVIVAAGLIWGLFGSCRRASSAMACCWPTARLPIRCSRSLPGRSSSSWSSAAISSMSTPSRPRPAGGAADPARQPGDAAGRAAGTDLDQFKKANELELRQLDIMLQRQKAVAEEQITAGQVRAKGLHDMLTADESLFSRGIISRLEVAQARADHDRTMLDIANARGAHHRGRGSWPMPSATTWPSSSARSRSRSMRCRRKPRGSGSRSASARW